MIGVEWNRANLSCRAKNLVQITVNFVMGIIHQFNECLFWFMQYFLLLVVEVQLHQYSIIVNIDNTTSGVNLSTFADR